MQSPVCGRAGFGLPARSLGAAAVPLCASEPAHLPGPALSAGVPIYRPLRLPGNGPVRGTGAGAAEGRQRWGCWRRRGRWWRVRWQRRAAACAAQAAGISGFARLGIPARPQGVLEVEVLGLSRVGGGAAAVTKARLWLGEIDRRTARRRVVPISTVVKSMVLIHALSSRRQAHAWPPLCCTTPHRNTTHHTTTQHNTTRCPTLPQIGLSPRHQTGEHPDKRRRERRGSAVRLWLCPPHPLRAPGRPAAVHLRRHTLVPRAGYVRRCEALRPHCRSSGCPAHAMQLLCV